MGWEDTFRAMLPLRWSWKPVERNEDGTVIEDATANDDQEVILDNDSDSSKASDDECNQDLEN